MKTLKALAWTLIAIAIVSSVLYTINYYTGWLNVQ